MNCLVSLSKFGDSNEQEPCRALLCTPQDQAQMPSADKLFTGDGGVRTSAVGNRVRGTPHQGPRTSSATVIFLHHTAALGGLLPHIILQKSKGVTSFLNI